MIDFSLITFYIILNIFEFIKPSEVSFNAIVLLDIILITLAFLKLCFFLRIYDGFSFLVSMLSGVFSRDIKYFMAFFFIFIILFGIIFNILFSAKSSDEYDGVGVLGYFIMIFRISSGDFSTDDYN